MPSTLSALTPDIDPHDERGFKLIHEQVDDLLDLAANPRQRVRTGLPSLDLVINGPTQGEVVCIVGRSFVGKSLIATNIMAANPDLHIIFFSLEMPAHQCIQRLLAHVLEIPNRDLVRAVFENALPQTISILREQYSKHVIVDADGLTLGDMGVYVANYDMYFGRRPDVVIIDYLEEIGGSKASAEGWVRTEATASSLKSFARREAMPVFVLHQANQKTEPWEPPTRSSAKGGGYTESDVVVGLYRPGEDPELPDWQRSEMRDDVYFNVIKNRITGRCTHPDHPLRFRLEPHLRLEDVEYHYNRRRYGEW